MFWFIYEQYLYKDIPILILIREYLSEIFISLRSPNNYSYWIHYTKDWD